MKIKSVVDGAPCWFEFASTDAPRSLAYFCSMFGWKAEHQDMGEFGTYTFLRHANGGMVGAHWQMPAEQKQQGIPSNWGVYFKVASVADSHKQALGLGAKELVAPMPVSDYGRMSVLSDPTGAVFSLWQEVASSPDELVMFESHAVGWIELATPDTAAARTFYQSLLPWHYSQSPKQGGQVVDYTHINIAQTNYGGMLQMTKEWEGIPPHWGLYFIVDEVDAAIKKSDELGGKLCVPAFDVPNVGRLAVLSDPTGANFYVIQMHAKAA